MQSSLISAESEPIVASDEDSCLVCDSRLLVSRSPNIFRTVWRKNGEILVKYIQRVLHASAEQMRSAYMCARCFELFRSLEQAQHTVSCKKREILKVYRSSNRAIAEKTLAVHGQSSETLTYTDGRLSEGVEFEEMEESKLWNEGNTENVIGNDKKPYLPGPNVIKLEISSFPGAKSNNDESRFKDSSLFRPGTNCGFDGDEKIENIAARSREEKTADATENFPKIRDVREESSNNLAAAKEISRVERVEKLVDTLCENSEESHKIKLRERGVEITRVEVNGSRCARNNKDASRFEDSSLIFPDEHRKFHNDGRIGDIAGILKEEKFQGAAENFPKDGNGSAELSKNSASPKGIPVGERVESLVDALCESSEESAKMKLSERGSWKSGRISKYSQKPLKYSCSNCEKKWRTLAELKTHVKSHSNLRAYMCEKCGRAYKHKHALEIHVGMHNGVSPFKCNVCDKCFTQKGALMRHLPMHTGETPYQCELCGKRFVHHTSYNMHALSHTGKKSYQCHLCDLSLLSTSHLKRHMRVHTGEKPYGCSLCGKAFAERYNLFAHRKIHDPAGLMAKASRKITFKCDRCDEYFDEEEKLVQHKIDHESDDRTTERTLLSPIYDANATTRNAELSGIRRDDIEEAEESWRESDYQKFDDSQIVSMTQQTDTIQESLDIFVPQENLDRTRI